MLFDHPKILKNFYPNHNLTLIKGGSEYFNLLEKLMTEAKESIYLQVYILEAESQIGERLISVLIKAAARGVRVYVLVDTIGSFNFRREIVSNLEKAGVHFRFFSPLFSRRGFHFGRRLHQKVLVIDSKVALVSGINIADRYLGDSRHQPWLDFGVLVEGPTLPAQLNNICANIWQKKFKKFKLKKLEPVKKPLSLENLVRVRQNDWARNKASIAKSYKYVFQNAENYITIVGAYFLPGRSLRKLIKEASGRGVQIKVILSKQSDERVFKLATSYLYDWLIRHGILIYEYQPTVVHAKAALSDDLWTTIGSHDLNFLSTYGLVEMNLEILDQKFASNFKKELDQIIKKDCREINVKILKEKSWTERIVLWFAYQVTRLSFWLLTFFNTSVK